MRSRAPQSTGDAVRAVGVALLWLSLICALFLAHQLWGTSWYTSRAQARLRSAFVVESAAAETPATSPVTDVPATSSAPATSTPTTSVPATSVPATTRPPSDPARVAAAQRLLNAETGEVIARIRAERIHLDKLVIEGVGVQQLRTGPGRYPGTAPFGGYGNTAVAGHRTTYGAPFYRLDELQPGDQITVTTQLGDAVYEVMEPTVAFRPWLGQLRSTSKGHAIVGPDDNFVLGEVGDNRLTLTACTPRFSARERIVVAAALVTAPFVELEPIGSGNTNTGDGSIDQSDSAAGVPPVLPSAQAGATTPAPESLDDTPATPTTALVEESALSKRALRAFDQPPSLRNGFDGLSGELAPVILLSLLLLVTITGITVASRHLGWLQAACFGCVPLLAVAWVLFEHLDKLLPAY